MKKKLTAQGPKGRKSYTVTLPIEWVKKESLDKTKLVKLNIVGNKAIVSSFRDVGQRLILDGDLYYINLIKVLQELYKAGANEIKLTFTNNKIVEEALNIIEQKLIGYEIIEQKKNYIIIKDITKESEEDFNIIFRRLFRLLLELAETQSNTQSIVLNRNIKKLVNYCQRILIKKGHIDFQKIPFYFLILDQVEKLRDEYRWLYRLEKLSKRDKSTLREIHEILTKSYELFYNFNPKEYSKFQYRTYELRNKIKLEKETDVATIHLHNLARILNSIYINIFVIKFGS